jgi:hypothetical protein
MGISYVAGPRADLEVLLRAIEKQPSLVIDCNNSANPLMLFPFVPAEKFSHVFVVPAESLYRFRAALKQLPELIGKVGATCVAVTSFDSLFAFGNENENKDVLKQCLELLENSGSEIILVKNGAHGIEPEADFGHRNFRAKRLRQIPEAERPRVA